MRYWKTAVFLAAIAVFVCSMAALSVEDKYFAIGRRMGYDRESVLIIKKQMPEFYQKLKRMED